MLDRPTARIGVSEDGRLMMISRLGASIFESSRLAVLESLGRSHYLRWDGGFEKAMDLAMDGELAWMVSQARGAVDRKELVKQIQMRMKWRVWFLSRGDILIYLPKWD